jgi:hypothetical protein
VCGIQSKVVARCCVGFGASRGSQQKKQLVIHLVRGPRQMSGSNGGLSMLTSGNVVILGRWMDIYVVCGRVKLGGKTICDQNVCLR